MQKTLIYCLQIAGLLFFSVPAGAGFAVAQEAAEKIPARFDSILSERPVLLFFTASWCGPCRLVKGVTFRDTEVAELLRRVDIRMVDVDTPGGKALQRIYGSKQGGIPELVLLDRTGKKIASRGGYNKDSRRTAEFLKRAFPAEEPFVTAKEPEAVGTVAEKTAAFQEVVGADTLAAVLPPTVSPDVFRSERPGFLLLLSASPWTLNFGAGALFSGIASSEFYDTRTGFYVSATTSLKVTRRWEAETGLMFTAAGGKGAEGVLRSYYLMLPAEVQYRVARFPWVDVFLSGGLYGACRVGYAAPEALVPERWDAGVLARLIVEAGTFRLSAGYSRGLMQCLGDRGYNRAFSVGLTICLGK